MERQEYLLLCQEVATLPERERNIKIHVEDRHKVIYEGTEYYPFGYKIVFDKKGNPIHTAILHDLNANSLSYVLLGKVERKIAINKTTAGDKKRSV